MTVIKKPGDIINIKVGIGIPLDGETWTYGIGCTLIDSARNRYNFTSYNKISEVPLASRLDLYGTVGQSQYMLKNTTTDYAFQATIPADIAEGMVDVYVTVWKKPPTGTEETGVTASDLIIDALESEAYDYQKKTWKMSLSVSAT